MKKLLLLTMLLAVTGWSFADGLNTEAQFVKQKMPDTYTVILAGARDEWPSDASMQLYTVNSQCKAFVEFASIMVEHPEVTYYAYEKYCYDLSAFHEDNSRFYTIPANWKMALYEAKKNLQAREAMR